ncbi:hypothetical protein [Streptomyces chromofuscus]|uniref:CBS domain-containing protein n=1 Tax=Streptomyces chromofuscus TaxID=42881 RepID=A0A7M2T9A8_STRCW|nr:hypothetical protein [Streptomyces chromofuscus]QOV44719.1 hypothetical protein IPT68_01435 [Streptomyces chromofuscus]GGT00828.1 hypothetical protein GCM10010254_21240 [Streptomyces chromofuscus]
MPFPNVAHTLAREQVSAVPVADADDHVVGVVLESDLKAEAAVPAGHRSLGGTSRGRRVDSAVPVAVPGFEGARAELPRGGTGGAMRHDMSPLGGETGSGGSGPRKESR